MKQKKLNNILYVFDITPYQITEDTDAEVIKVQEECVAGFKELNESLADKIVAYNYHVMCVQVPEWAPYVDEPDPTPKENPELAWSAESATVTIGAGDNVFPTLTNPHSVTVTYSCDDPSAVSIDQSTGEITLVAAGSSLIIATFAGDETYESQTVSYSLIIQEAVTDITITFNAQNLTSENVTVKSNGTETTLESSYVCHNGDILEFFPLEDPTYYTASGMTGYDDTVGQEHWWYTVGNADATIGLTYTALQNNEEQPE